MENRFSKAQANIEFIGGFFLFLAVAAYVAFTIMNALPSHYAAIEDNTLRLEAWRVSGNLIGQIAPGGYVDDSKLSEFQYCVGYDYSNITSRGNYTKAKSLLNVSDQRQIHITLEEFPVAVLDSGDSTYRSGAINVDGSAYTIEARNSSLMFNETKLSIDTAWKGAGGLIEMNGKNYTVASIGQQGDYVIFKRTIANCGPSIATSEQQAEIKKYVTYRTRLMRATLTYW